MRQAGRHIWRCYTAGVWTLSPEAIQFISTEKQWLQVLLKWKLTLCLFSVPAEAHRWLWSSAVTGFPWAEGTWLSSQALLCLQKVKDADIWQGWERMADVLVTEKWILTSECDGNSGPLPRHIHIQHFWRHVDSLNSNLRCSAREMMLSK
jgi:hypothetical protein